MVLTRAATGSGWSIQIRPDRDEGDARVFFLGFSEGRLVLALGPIELGDVNVWHHFAFQGSNGPGGSAVRGWRDGRDIGTASSTTAFGAPSAAELQLPTHPTMNRVRFRLDDLDRMSRDMLAGLGWREVPEPGGGLVEERVPRVGPERRQPGAGKSRPEPAGELVADPQRFRRHRRKAIAALGGDRE